VITIVKMKPSFGSFSRYYMAPFNFYKISNYGSFQYYFLGYFENFKISHRTSREHYMTHLIFYGSFHVKFSTFYILCNFFKMLDPRSCPSLPLYLKFYITFQYKKNRKKIMPPGAGCDRAPARCYRTSREPYMISFF
jgi:hypothetical protein